jgi:hypothetical protein
MICTGTLESVNLRDDADMAGELLVTRSLRVQRLLLYNVNQ